MSRTLVALVVLSACTSSASVEQGEAGALRGLDPLGSELNPALAGCEVTRERDDRTDVARYDRLGRVVETRATVGDVDTVGEIDWRQGCREVVTTTRDDVTTEREATCDGQGWPTSAETRDTSDAGTALASTSFENTYEDGRIAKVVRRGDEGDATTVFGWDGDRLVRVEVDGEEVTELTWRDDGQLAERSVTIGGGTPDVSTWVYDELDRPVERRDDGATVATYFYDGDARWPSYAEFTGFVTMDLVYDCP